MSQPLPILAMRVVRRMTLKQISAELGISYGTVAKREWRELLSIAPRIQALVPGWPLSCHYPCRSAIEALRKVERQDGIEPQ
jgi:hypothetical protein